MLGFLKKKSEHPRIAQLRQLGLFSTLKARELRVIGEYTLASTSQMMDMKTGRWSQPIFDELSLPVKIMPQITMPGTVVGDLTDGVAKEIGCPKIPVIAIGSHDTASAVLGVVGAGGLGALLHVSLNLFQHHRTLSVLAVVILLVTAVDLLSGALRRRIVEGPAARTEPRAPGVPAVVDAW